MKLTREKVYELITEEAEYATKYDCKTSSPPRSLADKDKPLELWLLWIQQYVADACKAATNDFNREEALESLRCALSMGVNAAIYHGLPSRNKHKENA
jgi:hypothetical protein